ncbi:MAG: hypothetical protein COA96_17030 [SAR86 cluster bacterium]|uniref:Uncharacterized protein n=1 Tax=SAR86 cluster bacterium TaxID=2030880 RepID=A0A2A5AG62_9GAMM|nr:MAG: hypothetical protein COA96_17030 [SAR86 cluster bacterium]
MSDKTNRREPADLKGKMIQVFLDGTKRKRGAIGSRRVRVVGVKCSRGRLTGLTVCMFSPVSGRYNGKRVRLKPGEYEHTQHTTGVLWFNRLHPIGEWLGAGGAA